MEQKQNILLKLFTLVVLFCLFNGGVAQASPSVNVAIQNDEQTVSGRVLDEFGDPIIGATVRVKGTQAVTVTDVDGNFTIKAAQGATLVVSYLGYADKEVVVSGNTVTISMAEDTIGLNEVVVTALGIKKEAKSLSYNVQQLNSDAVMKVQDANFVNSLNGKVAGVQFSQSSAGVGSATRVVMRGVKSINGDNNVLYVVDGIPMQNIASDQPTDMFGGAGSTGDAASNINPDDIESISVLSGPSAAALYGSAASNGVILITTKKGQEGRLDITYTGSFQFARPFVKHHFQQTYGSKDIGAYESWGDKLATPTTWNPNDFFQTGTNYTNSVSLSTGTERNQTYLSLGSTNSEGIIHNNNYNRYNVSVRNTSKFLNDKLTLDLGYNLSNVKEQNMISQGQYHNPLYTLYTLPVAGDWQGIQYYYRHDVSRNLDVQYWPWLDQNDQMENPYWVAEKERFINHKTRNTLTGTLKWDLADWISLTGRAKYDSTNEKYETKLPAGTKLLFASTTGHYKLTQADSRQLFAEAFATINKYFDQERWNLTAVIGGSFDQRNYDSNWTDGNLAVVPNLFSLNNMDNTDPKYKREQKGWEIQKQAVYGSAQLGYKSRAYLDLTARNDWSSALAGSDDSYFYYSAGISGIFTEIFPQIKNDYLNYFKARVSYSVVGNDPWEPFLTIPTYEVNGTGPQLTTSAKNPYLKPEKTKSKELGIDLILFKNRLKLNATLYKSRTYNQFFNIKLDPTLGYTNGWVNGGRVDNKGIELAARYSQSFGKLNWESYLTWTLNRNEIKEVEDEFYIPALGAFYPITDDGLNLGGFNGTRNHITNGGDVTDIYVRTLRTGEHGEIYVDPQDHQVRVNDNDYILAGHASPNYNLSWGNNFEWKGFNLGFLFNYRNGGIVVSLTESLMDYYGTSVASALARDNGGVVINGINGVTPISYYQTIASPNTTIASQYVYSATNLRLSELTFGYDFPINKWVNWVKGLNLSFVAHNLWMIYCHAPFDPELTANTGTYSQGIDYFMQPSTRTLGFSVKVKF